MYRVDTGNTGRHPTAAGPKRHVAEAWQVQTDSDTHLHAVDDTGLYYDDVGDVYRLDPDSQSQTQLVTGRFQEATIAVQEATGYVGGWGVETVDGERKLVGRVLAVDIETGDIQWSFVPKRGEQVTTEEHTDASEPLGSNLVRAPLTVTERGVYVLSYGYEDGDKRGGIHLLNQSDGTTIWQTDVSGWPHFAPAVAESIVCATVSGDDGFRVVVFDTTDGSTKREVAPRSNVAYTAPVVDRGRLYVGAEGAVYSTNLSDGSVRWSYETTGRTHPPAIGNGVGYVTAESELFAVDLASGDRVWRADGTDFTEPIVADGTVYVGDGTHLRAFDGETGEELWNFETRTKLDVDVLEAGVHAPLAAGDRLYAATDPGDVYALEEG